MAITLDATVGSATANCFVTEDELLAYASTRLNITGFSTSLTEDEKKAACQATRTLNVRGWEGQRASDTQSLAWPRWNAVNPDSPNHFLFLSDVIPQRVKDACCELSFVATTTDLTVLDSTLNIRRKKVDVLETEYFDPFQRAQGLRRFPQVWDLIQPLLSGSSNSVQVIRG